MLKTLVEKIELRRNRKNLGPIEKIKALMEALCQENTTDFFNTARLIWYNNAAACLNPFHQISPQITDALHEFMNAGLKFFKDRFSACRDCFRTFNTAISRH
jgi:hypothetical protein